MAGYLLLSACSEKIEITLQEQQYRDCVAITEGKFTDPYSATYQGKVNNCSLFISQLTKHPTTSNGDHLIMIDDNQKIRLSQDLVNKIEMTLNEFHGRKRPSLRDKVLGDN